MTETIKVIVAWMDGMGGICSLAYNNGKGKVRVYEKDRYDARIDLGRDTTEPIPFFDDKDDAFVWFSKHKGPDAQCQLAVGPVTQAFGFKQEELDEDISIVGCR